MKTAHLIPMMALFPLAGAGCGVVEEAVDLARRATDNANREARSGSRVIASASGNSGANDSEAHDALVSSTISALEYACALENDCYGESYDCTYAADDFNGVSDDCMTALLDYANCVADGECYVYEDEYGESYYGMSGYYDCEAEYDAYAIACFG